MFTDVYLVTPKLRLSSPEAISALEAELGSALPPGYQEFMNTLGEGLLNGLIRVYPPERVLEETATQRDYTAELFSWEENADVFDASMVQEMTIFGDSMDGDLLAWLPSRTQMVVLPRHDDVVYRVPAAIVDPTTWKSPRDVTVGPQSPFRFFESFVDRNTREWVNNTPMADFNGFVNTCLDQWSGQNRIVEQDKDLLIALVPAVQGTLQLTKDPSERVCIRLDFDADLEHLVAPWSSELQQKGFEQVGTHSGEA